MRILLHWVLIAAVAAGVASCGYKSKVRSPTQIEAANAKKAKRAAKQAQDESPDDSVPTPNVDANGIPVPASNEPLTTVPAGQSSSELSVIPAPPPAQGSK